MLARLDDVGSPLSSKLLDRTLMAVVSAVLFNAAVTSDDKFEDESLISVVGVRVFWNGPS